MHRIFRSTAALACALGVAAAFVVLPASARHGEPPYSLANPAKAGVDVPIEDAGAVDAAQLRRDADRMQGTHGVRDKRQKVAASNRVSITPDAQGRWDTLDDGSRLWRVRVRTTGATDLRLAFAHFALPRGATLYLIGAHDFYQGPYTSADALDGTFHSAVVPGDTATVELRVPPRASVGAAQLEISRVGAGFRDLFKRSKAVSDVGDSGACNINVACPLGQPYPNEIRAVGHYEFDADDGSGTYICTGTLVADVPHDRRNWFLTAHHCMSTASEPQSMVVYWNYQSTQCGSNVAPSGGYFNDDQHGATLRATRADTDFTLVELAGTPDTDWNLYYAGWDASGNAPGGTIGIHHPSGDVKKVTAGPRPTTMDGCISSTNGSSTHWHAGPYSQGTTEGGSSGSGLFSAAGSLSPDRRLIGTLSGGSALCSDVSPSQPNNGYDCYGKLSVGWTGSSAAARLRDWLDPDNTGATATAGIDQNAATSTDTRGHSTHALPEILRNLPPPNSGAHRSVR